MPREFLPPKRQREPKPKAQRIPANRLFPATARHIEIIQERHITHRHLKEIAAAYPDESTQTHVID
jgi:hypothetical protein